MNRRKLCQLLAASAFAPVSIQAAENTFSLNYTLSSAMYGDLPLEQVLAEVKKAGAQSVDIWRKRHATHREQIEEIGDDSFQELLKKHDTRMDISTCYPLGPFKQDNELRWVKKNGGSMTVCGSGRMKKGADPVGAEAKIQVKAFFEKLKPHYQLAEELGVTMAIENHKNSMLSSPDSIRYFAEFNPSKNIGIAFAPHHLHDAIDEIPKLINELGDENLAFIYFQEFHPSSKKTMSKVDELKQMPGFGSLDYVPILAALSNIQFSGMAEIFMHPTPRGIPMLPTAEEITWVINQSRAYLNDCIKKL